MRAIDADALIEKLDAEPEGGYYSPHDVISLLMTQPVVEERKTGKWIDMGDFEQCSVCSGTRLKEIQTFYGKAIWIKTDFCPNCGADMRGEGHETD